MNGGRNYNGPKVNELASLSKIWLYAGKSEYPKLRDPKSRENVRVQTISRKGQWEETDLTRKSARVCGRARLQSCRNGGKIEGASAPEVSPPPAGILRDYMPDSNLKLEKI